MRRVDVRGVAGFACCVGIVPRCRVYQRLRGSEAPPGCALREQPALLGRWIVHFRR